MAEAEQHSKMCSQRTPRRGPVFVLTIALALVATQRPCCATCTTDVAAPEDAAAGGDAGTLKFTMIPDQADDVETARADAVASYLSRYLERRCESPSSSPIDVSYVPAEDYADAVDLLVSGRVDFGWYGGLTGVEASLMDPSAVFLTQRIEDQNFTSVFIIHAGDEDNGGDLTQSGMGLGEVDGKSLAYGSELSTSGHLMPAFYLNESGVTPGSTVFTGSHDRTVDMVGNGTYQIGALNSIVWERRVRSESTGNATLLYTTPPYPDYLWVAAGDITGVGICGDNIMHQVLEDAFVVAHIHGGASASSEERAAGATLLTVFETVGFVPVDDDEYLPIEVTACSLGLIQEEYCLQSHRLDTDARSDPSSGATKLFLSSLSAAFFLLANTLY